MSNRNSVLIGVTLSLMYLSVSVDLVSSQDTPNLGVKVGVVLGDEKVDEEYARQPGVIRKPVPGDLIPAEKPVQRLTQARQIRQRFAAHEKANVGGRIELRPLSNPLYRYADEQTGVIDGAIFAFANGTNPEVLLLLEAQRDSANKQAVWTYGFAQMTGAEVYASFDEREVWSQPNADPPASRDSYVNGWLKDELRTEQVPKVGPQSK